VATRGRKADGARGARVGRAAEGPGHGPPGGRGRVPVVVAFWGGTDRREGLDRVVTRRAVSLNLPPTGGLRSASAARRFFRCGRVQAGFSLLEALFVVAILGILLALAFPSYQRVVMERRVQNTTREIAGLLRAAQQAAVAKSAEVACVRVEIGDNSAQAIVVPGGLVRLHPPAPRADGSRGGLAEFPGLPARGCWWSPVLMLWRSSPAGSCILRAMSNCTAFRVTVHGGGYVRYVCVNPAGLVTVPPPGASCP
jgi:prepilin-type N-terminal cleavage/methylation domain-containing protein